MILQLGLDSAIKEVSQLGCSGLSRRVFFFFLTWRVMLVFIEAQELEKEFFFYLESHVGLYLSSRIRKRKRGNN